MSLSFKSLIVRAWTLGLILCVWGSLSFLNLDLLLSNLGKYQALFLQIFFKLHSLFPFILDSDDMNVRYFVIVPQVLKALFTCFLQSIFCLFFKSGNLYSSSSSSQIVSSIISFFVLKHFQNFKILVIIFFSSTVFT